MRLSFERRLPSVLHLAAATAFMLLFSSKSFAQWTPPAGIPVPPFGITQVAPAEPASWTGTVAGFYYVCPTCSGARRAS